MLARRRLHFVWTESIATLSIMGWNALNAFHEICFCYNIISSRYSDATSRPIDRIHFRVSFS